MGTGRFGKIVKTIFLLILFVTAFTACTAKQEENTAEVFNLPETAGVSESVDSTTADDNSTETAGLSESEVQEISVLRDGKMIYGRVYLPAGKSPFPVVIIAHGFNNNISFTTGYAEAFQKAGIAACVFDFIGGGYGSKSDGSMSEMSVLTEAADINAVIDTVCAMDNIDDNSLFLMGLSQGGFVATYVAGTRPQDVQGLIAFYPAYVLQDDARERIAGLSEIPETTTLMGATIGRVYTEDALSFDIYEVMKNYAGNALIVHGTADNIVPVTYSERAAVTMEAAALLKIEGAGHGFYGKDDLTATEAAINFINQYK